MKTLDREKRVTEWTRTVRAGPDGTAPPPSYAGIFGNRHLENKLGNAIGSSVSTQSTDRNRSRDGAGRSNTSAGGLRPMIDEKRRR